MKQFELYEETIEFSNQQEEELKLFGTIYNRVFSIIKKNFELKFVNYKWHRKKDGIYIDDDDIYNEIDDELMEIFVSSCASISDAFLTILTGAGIYSFNRNEMKKDVELALEHAFEFSYEPHCFDGDRLLERINDYNRKLQSDSQSRLLFLADLAFYVTDWLKDSALKELYLADYHQKDENLIENDISAFDENDYYPALIHNRIRPIRENIEAIGINNQSKGVYINTFQKDPFSVRSYFYLANTQGDTSGELDKLFNFVFGSDYVLQIYKTNIVNSKINDRYPGYARKVKITKDINTLEAVNKNIKDLRLYYNLKYLIELEVAITNRLNQLKKKETDNKSSSGNSATDTSGFKRNSASIYDNYENKGKKQVSILSKVWKIFICIIGFAVIGFGILCFIAGGFFGGILIGVSGAIFIKARLLFEKPKKLIIHLLLAIGIFCLGFLIFGLTV